MPQFTLLAVDEDGVCTTTKEFETVFLNDAVEYYSDFLRGVGYEFNELSVSASLGEVPEEEINVVKSDSGQELKKNDSAYVEEYRRNGAD